MVSVERIYQFIRKDKLEGGKLYLNCRHKLKHRKRYVGAGVAHIPDRKYFFVAFKKNVYFCCSNLWIEIFNRQNEIIK